jgi:hypothetical protein
MSNKPDRESLDRYEAIGRQLPNEVAIGSALITMVEPDVGHEHSYNRWYEDDHFYAGAMAGPWTFAGKRWVAPRRLQLLRIPRESPIAAPVTLGCYLSVYWTTASHEIENERWSYITQAESLNPLGRGFPHREHIYTAFHRYRGAALRPGGGPLRPEHALDHRFDGLVLEVVDADDSASALVGRLHDGILADLIAGTDAAICTVFEVTPFGQGGAVTSAPARPPQSGTRVRPPENIGRRLCLLWFLDHDPEDAFPSSFQSHVAAYAAAGGQLLLSAPFIPTDVGTDRYVDELR